MNRWIPAACLALATFASSAKAQIGTAFTYQGALEINGTPFTGNADFIFEVFNAQTGGTAFGSDVITNVPVSKGVFSCVIDEMAANAFDTGPRYMGVFVRAPAGVGSYVPLSSRQRILPSPYSIRSNTSARSDTAAKMDGVDHVSGNIGIGTNNPQTKLHVQDGAIRLQNGALQLNFSTGGATDIKSPNSSLYLNASGGAGHIVMQVDPGAQGVGIGTSTPTQKFEVAGNMKCDVLIIDGGSDVSEPYDIAPVQGVDPKPGMVVAIDPDQVGKLRVCDAAYDRTVAGIISGANGIAPGLILSQTGTVADGEHPVASSGRVWCYVDADAGGSVVAGDLLTTSTTPGHAMKASEQDRAGGAVLGKAMSPLSEGKGLVLVLVSLQ